MQVKRTLAMHRSKLTPPVKRLHFQSRAYANKHNQSECMSKMVHKHATLSLSPAKAATSKVAFT